ncbi:SIMPL domain-containing protein [Pontivivens ytuae]|uniref:SIMPL domain-containing protein n=1 Tax=Pontivivens ytuae TaxID=2789856 RepID=A0A7S9LUC5_9RHOB|nr:SIMPL domain-containing protein [Pontivivens ytuae]QPH55407.1 SIMPL domain-containing protein [Pontivivens ytuae]
MSRLSLLLIALLLPAAPAALAQEEPAPRIVSVEGYGEVFAAPDMATVRIGVSSRADTAAAALRENNEAMQQLFDVLDTAGIVGADRQTAGLSLFEVRGRRDEGTGEYPIIGYDANNTLVVRVTKLSQLGTVLDDLTQAGANNIQGINFGVLETAALEEEARRLAVQDAVSRATLYVETAGAALGPVQSISERGSARPQPMPMVAMERAMVADAVPVAEGEVGITARVGVTFLIE